MKTLKIMCGKDNYFFLSLQILKLKSIKNEKSFSQRMFRFVA